jgi:hypothetical protein
MQKQTSCLFTFFSFLFILINFDGVTFEVDTLFTQAVERYKKHFASAFIAKKKCRKFETNIPRKGISGPQSQFPQSCVCERIIYSHDGLPFLLEKICGPILGIYKSLTDT